ncbi:peptidase M15 [Polaribacter porphyrae]|uniref:D-alanyl-D-alanine dipeptidase n=1 Tax=Polaribacter porphyrae TaxID=1137780 RepID=A0A2S7WU70_9FLAO|nr:peptidase M15 [Polaribacter porphyrae]
MVQVQSQELVKGFVYLADVDSSIKSELRYFSNQNFIGKPIDGYKNNCVIVTKETAKVLKIIQKKLLKEGLSLKIFDAYRPQQAVDHFVKWAKELNDTLMKKEFYPKVPKSELFKRGYIASKSGHTRGSTVDLTIVNIKTGKELDMGSPYDFFGAKSHPFYRKITEKQKENRMLLRRIMLKNGFNPYDNEWWHFTLKNEPFPKTYFNFPVQ